MDLTYVDGIADILGELGLEGASLSASSASRPSESLIDLHSVWVNPASFALAGNPPS